MLRTVPFSLLPWQIHRTHTPAAGVIHPCSAPLARSMAKNPVSKAKRPAVSKEAVAIPPTEATMQLTALVEHILVQKEGQLSEVIAKELDISRVGL